MEVEDKIQLAYISEVLVQDFYETLHEFQDDQLVLILVNDSDEVKTGEPFVYYFVFFVVQEVAHFGLPCDDQLVNLLPIISTSLRILCL